MDNRNHNSAISQVTHPPVPQPPSLPFALRRTEQEEEFNLRQSLALLRRRALLVTGVTAAVMSIVIVQTLGQERVYEGKFRLLVEPVNTSNDLSSIADALSQQVNQGNSGELDYETQIQVLRSPELLQKVVQPLQQLYPEITYGNLVSSLTIVRPQATKILQISYRSNDPDRVETVLRQLASEYLEYSLVERQTNLRQGIQFIDQQLPDLQRQVDRLQAELQQFRQKYNFIEPTTQAGQLSERAGALEQQRLALEQEVAKAQSAFQSLQQENGSLAALRDAPVYQQLISQLRNIETNIATELTRFQEESLTIRVLQEQRQNLLPVLRQEAQRVVGTQLADAITQLQILQARSQALDQAQAQLDQNLEDLPALSRRYTDLQRELEIATEGLTRFLANRQTLQIQAAQTEIPWQIIEAPTRPEVPISPNIRRSLMLGLVVSALVGVGAALLLEKLDNVYHTSEDLKAATKLPLLGRIPYQNQYEEETDPSLTLVARLKTWIAAVVPTSFLQAVSKRLTPVHSSNGYYGYYGYGSSQFSEALRVLHTNLKLLSTDRPLRSVIITSALPGDGKSTISMNLAQTAMTLGQRVLLVDADMRRPQIHERMGLTNLHGLSTAISSDVEAKSCFQNPIPFVEFSVLPSGPIPPDPAKLLASRKMQQLSKEFEQDFDLVIYDMPPLLGLADATLLAPHTDGIILIASLGKTDRSAITQAIDALRQANLPILGVIANDPVNRNLGTFQYYSNQSYGIRT